MSGLPEPLLDLLRRVEADQRAAGETWAAPAGPAARAAAREGARRLGAVLPDAYAAFLAHADGLDWDGVVFYGSGEGLLRGIEDANLAWREVPGAARLLVLGETDMDLLTIDASGGGAALRDRIGLEAVERFADVAGLLAAPLAARLGR